MCKETLLKGCHLVDASRDEYQYTKTNANQGCMKHKLITQKAKEKDWQAETTPYEQIPKQKHQEVDVLRKKRGRLLPYVFVLYRDRRGKRWKHHCRHHNCPEKQKWTQWETHRSVHRKKVHRQ
jgi:hypothetical protein